MGHCYFTSEGCCLGRVESKRKREAISLSHHVKTETILPNQSH